MTTPAAAAPPQAQGGNFLTRKVAGMPMWIVLLAGLGALLAVTMWRSNKAGQKAQDTSSADTASAQDVPPFIIQNFESGPGAPGAPGPAGPRGRQGPPGHQTQGGKPPNPPGRKPPPTFNFIPYRIKHGDTLSSIAKKHHLDTWTDVFEATTQANAQRPNRATRAILETMEKAGAKGRLPAGKIIYLPKPGTEQ